MDIRFLPHNRHLEGIKTFKAQDPQLRLLSTQPFIFESSLIAKLPSKTPGIYSLGGGRQIGKTTLLKQWMLTLLQNGHVPSSIYFMTGELINDHHTLLRLLQGCLDEMPAGSKTILVDEITDISDWDKALKYAADAGLLQDVVLLITGSDLTLMKEARLRLPGRRGKASQVDFHLFPLSFKEWVHLKRHLPLDFESNRLSLSEKKEFLQSLYQDLESYLVHGGFLTAINEIRLTKKISPATCMTYSDWIRGDMVKRGKQEHYLAEVLGALCKRYGSQVSWNALAKDLSIDHPKTVSDYIELLAAFDAVFIQSALLEDKRLAAPKKPKKIYFSDPFIFHAIRAWLSETADVFESQILPFTQNPQNQAVLLEGIVAAHFRRHYPTYYIKAEGEVDIAYVKDNRFWPIELKWTNQLRPKDLKQIQKYPNGRIWGKTTDFSDKLGTIPYEPLPWALYHI